MKRQNDVIFSKIVWRRPLRSDDGRKLISFLVTRVIILCLLQFSVQNIFINYFCSSLQLEGM